MILDQIVSIKPTQPPGIANSYLSPDLVSSDFLVSFPFWSITGTFFFMLVTPVMNGCWLLTRRRGPVKPVWLNALCISLTWVQKWWSLMSGSFISLVGTRAYCGSSVALRWLSWWIYLSFNLLDKVPHSLLQSLSYRQQREGAVAVGDCFSVIAKVL